MIDNSRTIESLGPSLQYSLRQPLLFQWKTECETQRQGFFMCQFFGLHEPGQTVGNVIKQLQQKVLISTNPTSSPYLVSYLIKSVYTNNLVCYLSYLVLNYACSAFCGICIRPIFVWGSSKFGQGAFDVLQVISQKPIRSQLCQIPTWTWVRWRYSQNKTRTMLCANFYIMKGFELIKILS